MQRIAESCVAASAVQAIVHHEADAFANLKHARGLYDVMYMYLYMRMYEVQGCGLVRSRSDGKEWKTWKVECGCERVRRLLGSGKGVCNFFGAVYGVENGYCWTADDDEA